MMMMMMMGKSWQTLTNCIVTNVNVLYVFRERVKFESTFCGRSFKKDMLLLLL